ncbi:hypothetical protein LIER_23717 [Lithospermum erythrorhizon]|uniref:Uncharacterized protein n=1 Tax=Lithospermum erythrorhizon TaxID=34254 RepID=A0AAV3QYK5_LITER
MADTAKRPSTEDFMETGVRSVGDTTEELFEDAPIGGDAIGQSVTDTTFVSDPVMEMDVTLSVAATNGVTVGDVEEELVPSVDNTCDDASDLLKERA